MLSGHHLHLLISFPMTEQNQYVLKLIAENRFDEAKSALDTLMLERPDDADILFQMGLVYARQSHYDISTLWFQKALKLDPLNFQAFYNIGLNMQNKGDLNSAVEYFLKVLAISPGFVNASVKIASLTLEINRISSKEEYLKTLDAQKLVSAGDYEPASELLHSILSHNPKNLLARRELARLSMQKADYEAAVNIFREIVNIAPDDASVCFNYALALQNLKRFPEAVALYERAVSLKPGYADALNNLGLLYVRAGRYSEAEEVFGKIIASSPDYIRAYDNLGYLKLTAGEYEEAEDYSRRVIELTKDENNPANAVAFGNLGYLAMKNNDLSSAYTFLTKAVSISPSLAQAHYNLAEVLLLSGDYLRGFSEYEWRRKKDDWIERNIRGAELQKDSDIRGKRILVLSEQGLGDSIQFVRYLRLLKEKGAFLILECRDELAELFTSNQAADVIIRKTETEKLFISYDYYVYLLSLPYILGTTLSSIPEGAGYLLPDNDKAKKWTEIISVPGKLKTGIVWAGSPTHKNDKNRSCRLSDFSPVAEIPSVELYCLQKGPALVETKTTDFRVTVLDDFGLTSFSETAAAIANLDLVISVDTSVAHLSAAMGKPTWLILPYSPDWRWMLQRSTSPWYNSIKIFRQSSEKSGWKGVFDCIREDISQLLSDGSDDTGKSRPEASESAGAAENDAVSILNEIALSYTQAGDYKLAADTFRKILQMEPLNDMALFNIALCLQLQGEPDEAAGYYKKSLGANPDNTGALLNLGALLAGRGSYAEALECFEHLESLRADANVYYNLGICYQNLERTEEAIAVYKKALELNCTHYESLNNLGLLYSDNKRFEESEQCFSELLSLNPDYLNGIYNLGHVKLLQDKLEEAEALFLRALQMMGGGEHKLKAPALSNLGVVRYKQGKIKEAIGLYDQAIDIDPEYVSAHNNKASALLLLGNFSEGWKEYEWRMQKKEWGKRKLKRPLPMRASVKGKRILVYGEQGYGDTIQFIRFIPMLKSLGCHIIFECDSVLFALLKDIECIDELIERSVTESPEIEYDFDIGLLSLPRYFNTEESSVPNQLPYIFADEQLSLKWKEMIDDGQPSLKVGFVWAGSPIHVNDHNRSCGLKNFEMLFDIPGIRFYSMQKGPGLLEIIDEDERYVNLDRLQMNTFSDTAAVIENLDLVITVDTSVAHLAAAMGKAVWILLPYVPDWRWMLHRNDSPWYPSVRLYRQQRIGDWSSVFKEVRRSLKSIAAGEMSISQVSLSGDEKHIKEESSRIYLGLARGENFGWGVCSKYLRQELTKLTEISNIEEVIGSDFSDGAVFQALMNIDFEALFDVKGKVNLGYTFFEQELNARSVENSRKFDLVLGGSKWNMEKLKEKGIENSGYLVQGIDPEIFYPDDTYTQNQDVFVIFSGGKFELRKGQDMVLRAFKILHEKYPDMVLINAWYNFWPVTMQSMSSSKYIRFSMRDGVSWDEFISELLVMNGIDTGRVITLPVVPNEKMREIYLKSNIGLFPNRCEGGTNLVMMEYMACGRPVVASFSTGQKDVLGEEHSFMLRQMKEYRVFNDQGELWAQWQEPSLDEVIAAIEYAYFHRDEAEIKGRRAAGYMRQFTWRNMAEKLMSIINQIR